MMKRITAISALVAYASAAKCDATCSGNFVQSSSQKPCDCVCNLTCASNEVLDSAACTCAEQEETGTGGGPCEDGEICFAGMSIPEAVFDTVYQKQTHSSDGWALDAMWGGVKMMD